MNSINRILVIEPDKKTLKQVAALLIDAGYVISQAANGEDAISLLHKSDPDLVLLNVQLPDLDGIEVCRKIKQEPSKDIFVILISDNSIDDDRQAEGLEFGGDGYIVRPVSNRELLARVKAMLRIKQAEIALRLSEERYRKIYEGLPVGYQSLDQNGCFIDVNQAWLSILGYERDEIIGKWFGDFLAPLQQELFRLRFPKFKQLGEVHNVEFEMVRKDGSHITVSFEGKIGYDTRMEFKQTHCVLADISERKQIENKIHESQEKFRNVFESANVGKSITSLNGDMSVNQALALMLGYSCEELVGRTWQSITLAEDIPLTQSNIEPLINGKKDNTRFNKRYLHKNGSIVWGDVSVTLLRDDAGTPLYFITTVIDITERIRIENDLLESQRRLTTLMGNLPGMAYRCKNDPNWTMEFISQGCLNLTGYQPEEILGNEKISFSEIIHPDDRQRIWDDIQSKNKQKKHFTLTYRIITKNGEVRWVFEQGTGIFNATNQLEALEGFITDITERKLIQDELAESERRFREMFSTVKLITLILNEDGNIAYCNDFLLDLIGWKREELVGKNWFFTCLPKRLQVEIHDVFLDAFKNGHVPPYHENEILTKSGEEKIILWNNVTLCDANGKVIGAASIGSDVTDQRKEKKELEDYKVQLESAIAARTQELEQTQEHLIRNEKLAVLGQLAGGVGHELRNPLGVISNAVYFLRMVQPDADPKIKKYIQMIETETRTAEKIINDLLDFTRIKSVDKVKVYIDELIAYTLERRPSPEGVVVVKNLPPALPEVDVDPKQIDQVFENLIANAYQAMPDGGTLTIAAKEISRMDKKYIKVIVRDTGVGITVENLPKMFEPLFTTKPKGIGLGLAVSKKLLEANEGLIEVQSEHGKGTEFSVYLPI